MRPYCIGCMKFPDELDEYSPEATETDMTPDEYVKNEEGTYNPNTGHFLCTDCYVKAGCPSSPKGWHAP